MRSLRGFLRSGKKSLYISSTLLMSSSSSSSSTAITSSLTSSSPYSKFIGDRLVTLEDFELEL